MEAQRLLDRAPYAPEVIDLLKLAFNEAWASIAPTTTDHMVGDVRLSLAHAIIAHAAKGERDPSALKATAIEAVRKYPPKVGVE
jgi:hypothetical protein